MNAARVLGCPASGGARRFEQRLERSLTEREKSKAQETGIDTHDLCREYERCPSGGRDFEGYDSDATHIDACSGRRL